MFDSISTAQAAIDSSTTAAPPEGGETKEDLRRRFDAQRVYMSSLKDDYERCQRKLLGAEMRIKELQTSTQIAKNAAEDAKAAAAQVIEEATRTTSVAENRANTAVDRLRFAPQVDNSVRRLYCDLRLGCFELLGASPLEDAHVLELTKKGTLEIAEDSRLWLKWIFVSISDLQEELQRLHAQLAATEGQSDRMMVAAEPQNIEQSRSVSERQSRRQVTRRHMTPDLKVDFDYDVEEEMLKDQLKSAAARENLIRERCERIADLARKDCASAKQEVRNHLKTIKELQAKLKKRESAEVSELALERAKRESQEAKKHLTVAVSAKQQEIDTLRRELSGQVQLLLNENLQLKKQHESTRATEAAIEDLRSATKNAESQLTRSGIQSASAELQRLRRLLDEKSIECSRLQQKLREMETTTQRLKRDCAVATNNYNAIFAAHTQDAVERQKMESVVQRDAVKNVLSTGALDVDMFRSQYRDAKEETRKMKRKLLHLLVLSKKQNSANVSGRSDDVRTSEEKHGSDDSSNEADKLDVSASVERSRILAQRALEDSEEPSEDDATEAYRQMLQDDTSPNSVAVLRISDSAIVVDTKIPVFGAVNSYGNPFEPQGIVHVTASTPTPGPREVSSRAISDIELTPAIVEPSTRMKRLPRHTNSGSAKVSHDFKTLLSGEPRPSSAAGVLTSIAKRRGLPLEGLSKQLDLTTNHRRGKTPHL